MEGILRAAVVPRSKIGLQYLYPSSLSKLSIHWLNQRGRSWLSQLRRKPPYHSPSLFIQKEPLLPSYSNNEKADKEERHDEVQASRLKGISPKFISSLHGLRGLSAISIALGHVYEQETQVYYLATIGFISFGMTSGSLITGILLRTLSLPLSKGKGWMLFAISRAVRIYPALLIASIYASSARYHAGHETEQIKKQVVTSLLQVENFYINENRGGFLTHTWYLGTEQQFYAIWPFFVAIIGRRSNPVRLGAILFALCVVTIIFLHNEKANARAGIRFGGVLPFPSLIYGGAMQLLPVHKSISQARWLAWIGPGLSAIHLIFAETISQQFPRAIFFLTPLYVYFIIQGCSQHGNILLEHSALVFMGRISYAYFLFHVPLLKQSLAFKKDRILGIWIVIGTVVPAALSTLYVEEPIRDWCKAKMLKKTEKEGYATQPTYVPQTNGVS